MLAIAASFIKRILTITVVGIGLLSLYLFVLPIPLTLIGYYPDGVGWKVAKEIVAKGGKVSDCKKIIHLISHPLSPSQGEQRTSCIHDVAELTKDPAACELLMPSSYGWDCLGGAMPFRLCIIGEGTENTVRGQGKITTYDQCLSGDIATKQYSCCVMARILNQKGDTEACSSLSTTELRDECRYFDALRNIDLDACAGIENTRMETGCKVGVKALMTKSR